MHELSTLDKARILIRKATGEEYGDGYTVTNLCVGYAEPGYGDKESVVVFGDWNPKRYPKDGDAPLPKSETVGPRLGNALERIGVECEWLDEWTECQNCYRAMRTQADSYSWQMYGALMSDGYICADCLRENLDSELDEYVNKPSKAITWCKGSDLEGVGFQQWEPGNPQRYENGWHEGQNDNPSTILESIREECKDEVEVVFLIDSVGQFDVAFSAYVRIPSHG